MDKIGLSLGSGGKLMRDFLGGIILKHLGNPNLDRLWDSAHVDVSGRVAFTTDSFVIQPLFFPGGDIGKLAVAGTVNDLVVAGARPVCISLALIIEEGFPIADMETILASVRRTADEAGVAVVTGDTKVVRKGEADRLYVNTAGIGNVVAEPGGVVEGDALIITGTMGDHAVAVMVARGEFDFEGVVESDCRPLHGLLPVWGMGVKWMRDITRGGLATILCELSESERAPIFLEEAAVSFSPQVKAVAEMLGMDPFYLACEGKALVVAPAGKAREIHDFLRSLPEGKAAAIIGRVGGPGRKGEAVLKSVSGGLRLLEPLTGELLPRIC